MICKICGFDNSDENSFCINCGNPLEATEVVETNTSDEAKTEDIVEEVAEEISEPIVSSSDVADMVDPDVKPDYNPEIYPVTAPVTTSVPLYELNKTKTKTKTETEASDDKTATILGVVSLCLMVVAPMIFSTFMYLFEDVEVLSTLFALLDGMCPLASIVVMIVGRVKYPKNTFLKVLMWVYIALLVLSIVAIIVFVIACSLMCKAMGCDSL